MSPEAPAARVLLGPAMLPEAPDAAVDGDRIWAQPVRAAATTRADRASFMEDSLEGWGSRTTSSRGRWRVPSAIRRSRARPCNVWRKSLRAVAEQKGYSPDTVHLRVTRKIVPLASSLTSSAPSRVTATPAGR